MRKYLLKKSLIVGIIILFTCSSFASSISVYSKDSSQADTDFENSYELEENVVVSCQAYGTTGKSIRQTEMSKTEAEEILDKYNDIAEIIASDPLSDETEKIHGEIISLAKEYRLLPIDTSFADFQPRFFSSLEKAQPRKGITPFIENRGTASLCSFATTGSGMQFPIIILPRLIPILLTPIPRAFLHWSANIGVTSCGSYLTGTGFIASGMQRGTALGFWGIGFSIFIPPVMAYGFIGYALFATCTAEVIEPWPPNTPPSISEENPLDGIYDVPVSLSDLSFKIEDIDGDDMDFVVRTYPDIGSANEFNKKDGVYCVPVSGLDPSQKYTWTVEVTDGFDTVNSEFFFITEELPFDPFDEGWQYRKKITIDHTKVEKDLENFPVLISTTDPDLKDKAQVDGDDIFFMDDVGVANKMYHELESYDNNSGEIIAWLNVDEISATGDNVLYLYYGNPNCENQQLTEAVWDSNYQAVWHLSEDGTGLRHDSTINHRHATPYNYDGDEATDDGVANGADEFDGVNDHLRTGISFDYEYRTVSFWFNSDIIPSSDSDVIITQDSNTLTYGSFKVNIQSDGIHGKAGGEESGMGFIFDVDKHTWYMIHLVRNSKNTEYYVNGNFVGMGESGNVGSKSNANPYLVVAARRSYDNHFDGILDEIRVSNVARSAEWIITEYNNQNDPLGFMSFGPEETGP